jgi:hypothetical protein
MVTKACTLVEDELMFLGDILAIGMVKKGLERVGSSPDMATPLDLVKAIDKHIEPAMVTFVGPVKARKIALKLKYELGRMGAY